MAVSQNMPLVNCNVDKSMDRLAFTLSVVSGAGAVTLSTNSGSSRSRMNTEEMVKDDQRNLPSPTACTLDPNV